MSAEALVPGYTSGEPSRRRLERLLETGGERTEIGRSREGRPLHAYRWTVRERKTEGPAATASRTPGGIFLLSLLHPMEWIGLEAHLALLEGWLLPERSVEERNATLQSGPRGPGMSSALPLGTEIYSIPVANPDGLARVEDALRRGRRRWVRGNSAGIDLNRNFPRFFRPRSRWMRAFPLYRPGPYALSEPETAAVAEWTRPLPLRISFSLHAFGRWLFYPPAGIFKRTPESESHRALLVRSLCGSRRDARSRLHDAGYRAGVLGRWSPLFRARGTELDFLAGREDRWAFLVEISRGGFGAWGFRRLLHPFYLFNPPHPERELSRLLPLLRALAVGALNR